MIDFILTLIFGLVIGYRVSAAIHTMGFKEILKALNVSEKDLRQALKKTAPDYWREKFDLDNEQPVTERAQVAVRIEQHHGQLYAFRKDTDQFLGQGSDPDQLIQRLNETMKPCTVNVSKEDGSDLIWHSTKNND